MQKNKQKKMELEDVEFVNKLHGFIFPYGEPLDNHMLNCQKINHELEVNMCDKIIKPVLVVISVGMGIKPRPGESTRIEARVIFDHCVFAGATDSYC